MPSEQKAINQLPENSSPSNRHETGESKLWKIQLGDRVHEANYQQAFALGHDLVKQRKYASARAVYEPLSHVNDRGPRAHIMLAICQSGLSEYTRAFASLKQAPDLSESMAAAIYDVIVQFRMGFKDDALHDLLALVNEHKELPTLCLWLGDMLEMKENIAKALQCWGLAVKRDRSGGAVGLAAMRQMHRLTKRPVAAAPTARTRPA